MKRYKITYRQKFMGDILEDSYIRTVKDEFELDDIVYALYEDDHVISVYYEEVD